MDKQYYVYIITNMSGTLYIGVTNNLERRIYEHREQIKQGFTSRYNIHRLLYFELVSNIRDAIAREKQLKKWRRSKKIALINAQNPDWNDLSEETRVTFCFFRLRIVNRLERRYLRAMS